jgi:hypothetical protein
MDKLRLNERNTIKNNIKQVETVIKKTRDTIERLSSQANSEFNKTQISKLQIVVKENEEKLLTLNNRYDDVSSGLLDDELRKSNDKTKQVAKNKQLENEKKVKEKNQKKLDDKEILDTEYKSRRREGMSDYQMQKETDRFFRNLESIPDYILQNLKDMPGNKGYIWKGIWCFGEKPAESEDIILFEKHKGVLKIHEITRTYRKVYEKIGKGPKTLISSEVRKPILSDAELEQIKRLANS